MDLMINPKIPVPFCRAGPTPRPFPAAIRLSFSLAFFF
jgi:hypothetical protein